LIDEDLLQDASVFRVGKVSSVEGRRVRISVDKLKNGSHLLYKGGIVRNVAVGSYIKIVKGFSEMIAKVDGEHVREDRGATSDYRRPMDPIARSLDVSLVGFLHDAKFERGVRELPLLDNECFILTTDEFESVHQFVGPGVAALPIGVLATEPTQTVAVGVDDIFASHIGIFGNTGSGKSYTLAKLYFELFRRFGTEPQFRERSQFVLIDFNGEYVDRAPGGDDYATAVIAGPELKRCYRLSTKSGSGDTLPLPRAAINDPIFWTVLLDATEKTQAPFLTRVLASDYWERLLGEPDDLIEVIADLVLRATKTNDPTTDRQTSVNFLEEIQACLGDAAPPELETLIQDFRYNLQYHVKNATYFWQTSTGTIWSTDPTQWDALIKPKITMLTIEVGSVTEIDLIRFKVVMQYYRDIISGFANREHLGPLIKRMHNRVPTIQKLVRVSDESVADALLTVVSLRDVNLAMRKVIPMLLCKQLYDRKKDTDPSGERYLNLIIDEAHNILSTQSSRETEAWRDYRLETFEEIVKEGRKFNVFLTIASQRPHDISETIISQLHNYFLHRLVNNLDIHAVERAVAYLDAVSFESLPILATGTCVLAGVSAQVPVIVKIGALPDAAAPNSRTMSVATAWA
jgi:DNA helicase HerA-like ATPase